MHDNIILKCSACGREHYITKKNKKNTPEKLELKKYCPNFKKAVLQKEKK